MVDTTLNDKPTHTSYPCYNLPLHMKESFQENLSDTFTNKKCP